MNPATITIATLSLALAGAVLAAGLMLHQNGKLRRAKSDAARERDGYMRDLAALRVELKRLAQESARQLNRIAELEGERDALATVPAGSRWQYEWNVN